MAQRDDLNAEQQRLSETNGGVKDWRRWGRYLSERQTGHLPYFDDRSGGESTWTVAVMPATRRMPAGT